MHQENFHEQVSMTTKEQHKRTTIYHQIANAIHAKSADYPRTASPLISSFETRSSKIYIDEIRQREEEERGLNLLNNCFANYLNQIKILGDKNINLRHQIDEIYQKHTEHIEEENQSDNKKSNSSEIELNNLRRQLNNELRKLLSFQIRLQRADYDKKYYKNKLKFFSTTHQIQILQQQLDANLYELNFFKEQYQKQEQNLQLYKKQYNEYTTKFIEYTNEYNNITFERMQIENYLYTLKEQLSFEHEYNGRCKQEFEDLETIQCDLNNQFNKTEFENTIKKIRQDYQKYNEIQLSEFELIYKIKFDLIQNSFQEVPVENHSEEIKQLTEQNQLLQQKFEQLENDFHRIIEQNRQQYEILNNEYNQLENQLPEFESFIQISRNNTVHLTSEINTYRCLLINLVQKPKPKPPDFVIHFENGIIWVRI